MKMVLQIAQTVLLAAVLAVGVFIALRLPVQKSPRNESDAKTNASFTQWEYRTFSCWAGERELYFRRDYAQPEMLAGLELGASKIGTLAPKPKNPRADAIPIMYFGSKLYEPQFSYSVSTEDICKALGEEGWELVTIQHVTGMPDGFKWPRDVYYWKRLKVP